MQPQKEIGLDEQWAIQFTTGAIQVKFKIDTGVDANIMGQETLGTSEHLKQNLLKSSKKKKFSAMQSAHCSCVPLASFAKSKRRIKANGRELYY